MAVHVTASPGGRQNLKTRVQIGVRTADKDFGVTGTEMVVEAIRVNMLPSGSCVEKEEVCPERNPGVIPTRWTKRQ